MNRHLTSSSSFWNLKSVKSLMLSTSLKSHSIRSRKPEKATVKQRSRGRLWNSAALSSLSTFLVKLSIIRWVSLPSKLEKISCYCAQQGNGMSRWFSTYFTAELLAKKLGEISIWLNISLRWGKQYLRWITIGLQVASEQSAGTTYRLMDNIRYDRDRCLVTALFLFNFSMVSDNACHVTLLSKLSALGFSPNILRWLASYLDLRVNISLWPPT